MKILFLHICDMHLKDQFGLNSFQISKVADTINSFLHVDRIVLIIAGDIAHSGTAEQYAFAKRLVGKLITALKAICPHSERIDVICVPGNHDLDHKGAPLTSEFLQGIRKVDSFDNHLSGELGKEEAFFAFANINDCFTEKSVFCRRILDYSGFTIEVNMINSGVFSILDEDKSLHYIPHHCINELSAPTGADFVITVMHHAPEWYTDKQKNILEEVIFCKSSIVFYGHEHYITRKTIAYESSTSTIVQTGGCLCENDNWLTSAFHVGVLDTLTREYNHVEFRWNSSQKLYEQHESMNDILPIKPSVEKALKITDTFFGSLLLDKKHDIAKDFRNYYVFPRIQIEDRLGNGGINQEFTSLDTFVSEILSRKRVLITGGDNSGKTSLLKMLFLHLLEKQYTVIFCEAESVRGGNVDRIIKNSFEDVYGNNDSDYRRYEQIPKSRKVLIIDDTDIIKPSSFDSLLPQLADKFEYTIFASSQPIDFSFFERAKSQLKAGDSIPRYKIMPLFSDKRQELIERIVMLKAADPASVSKTSKLLADAITAQRRFISLDPDFIIKFIEVYCNNIGEASSSDSGIFSKVFEASITAAISKYQTQKLSVDKIIVLLSKVAHFIHFHRVYPISEQQVMAIVDLYNNDYGANVRGTDFLRIASQTKILVLDDSAVGYRFANKNHLAYFVAKEVNIQYNATGDSTDLFAILKCACFGINSDILLFISYITDNIRILRHILQMVNEYTRDWSEFSFNDMPPFLHEERIHNVELPPADARQKEQQAEVMAEKANENGVQTVDIYDYSDEDLDNFINQLIRAIQLLIIAARCLPNFEQIMPKADKEAFVQVIYSLPNKVFSQLATIMDKEFNDLYKFFRDQPPDYYYRQKKPSDDDIVRMLQWAAMSFLLQIYNLTVFHATKDNTIEYLSNFNFSQEDTYDLEHLMMLERQASPSAFITKAINVAEKKKIHFYPILVARVVSHALVYRSDFDYSHVQQLQSRFFPNKETQKKIMTQRNQNKNIENE